MVDTVKRLYAFPSVRFLAVGVVNFTLVYVVYLGAIRFVEYRSAYWISVVVGLLFTSIMNIHHTFERKLKVYNVVIYGVYYYGYSLLHVTLLTFLIENLGVLIELGPILTMVTLTPPHYVASKYMIRKIAHVRR